jgi:hypothetical protein
MNWISDFQNSIFWPDNVFVFRVILGKNSYCFVNILNGWVCVLQTQFDCPCFTDAIWLSVCYRCNMIVRVLQMQYDCPCFTDAIWLSVFYRCNMIVRVLQTQYDCPCVRDATWLSVFYRSNTIDCPCFRDAIRLSVFYRRNTTDCPCFTDVIFRFWCSKSKYCARGFHGWGRLKKMLHLAHTK